ncbi:S46 family peptidase [Alteromonas sediminis]|uniref:Dipeptidyl-peptidase n=1 Tax=Alteromonas sediminis TaxID=2259342 RepID=A0A3N5Y827_9ALTE|nr:S46 family peptidase [Alteromonas sediminis]RPJ67069.1 S46 family peptidase [Alteromonas sediminis]
MKKTPIAALFAVCATVPFANAGEGMYTPEQLPKIEKELRQAGLAVDPAMLSSLTAFPMGAIVDLAGCTGSFVSDQGLVVTNHHCARGSVQFNSSAENNYLEEGFLAKTPAQEIPAAPGSYVYVTTDFSDVTNQVLDGTANLTGKDRFDAIERNRKSLIAECEMDEGHRCEVPAFFGGKEYKLIKQLEIRDVRIAYSPADSIGRYGGDIDNWMWPRHTGDFAFYRAYVGPDGKPADFSEDNVPYQPPHVLKVSAAPLQEGDFVMVAGYPGSTNRYARQTQVSYVFDWLYPNYIDLVENWIGIIESSAPQGSDARVKYESYLASLNNFLKNTKGQISGAKRVGLVERRAERQQAMSEWLAKTPKYANLQQSIERLDELREQKAQLSKQQFWFVQAKRSQLLSTAQTLYKFAVEQEKPDAEREFGYQDRDRTQREQQMMRLDRRFDATVDKAVWMAFIEMYLSRPQEERVAAFDNALGLTSSNALSLPQKLEDFYRQTQLMDVDQRLALLKASKETFDDSSDPFVKLAVALYDTEKAIEDQDKALDGEILALQKDYMEAVIAWQASQGTIAYPDANSTLRVTYGSVLGGSPKDGLIYEAFTRLEGISQKDMGSAPFNAPQKQLDLIQQKAYGPYADPVLGTVPVNFLTDLDSTGGNSGSATLNANAELVGLLFDGTIESVNSDWDFDPRTTRSIHVDSRYMLWIMEYVDGAQNLLEEMDIVGKPE